MGFRLTQYNGFTEIDGRNRYAMEYGPILLSYTGSSSSSNGGEAQAGGLLVPRIAIDPAQLVAALQPVAGQPLHWSVSGDMTRTYEPYWLAAGALCCYPMIGT